MRDNDRFEEHARTDEHGGSDEYIIAQEHTRAEEYEIAHIREWYWLTNLPGLGAKKIAALMKAVENVVDLYNLAENVGEDRARDELEIAVGNPVKA